MNINKAIDDFENKDRSVAEAMAIIIGIGILLIVILGSMTGFQVY